MKKCSNCGNILADEFLFCNKCGFSNFEAYSSIQEKTCPSCGSLQPATAVQCSHCATLFYAQQASQVQGNTQYTNQQQIPQQQMPQQQIPQQQVPQFQAPQPATAPAFSYAEPAKTKGKSKAGLWVILVLIILVLVGVTALLIYTSIDSDDSKRTSSSRNKRSHDTLLEDDGYYGNLDIEDIDNSGSVDTSSRTDEDDVLVVDDKLEEDADASTEAEIATVSTYEVTKTDITWESANTAASSYNSHLIYIDSKEEFDMACHMAEDNGLVAFWLGAKLYSTNQSWANACWLNGEEFTYSQWFPGEPTYTDQDGNPEYYLMAFKVDKTWYFNDTVDDISIYYPGQIGYITETETEVSDYYSSDALKTYYSERSSY